MSDLPDLPEGFFHVHDVEVGWTAVAYFIAPNSWWELQSFARTEGVADEDFVAYLGRSHAKLVAAGNRMLTRDDVVKAIENGAVLSASMRHALGV